MGDKNREKRLRDVTLASVVKETAKPRLAASVRKGIGKTPMNVQAKFSIGILVHNRNTKEDGLVKRAVPLSGVGSVRGNFLFHLVFFPATWFLSGEGFSAAVACITAIECGVVNLLAYPSLL